jgi:hypothetical protein
MLACVGDGISGKVRKVIEQNYVPLIEAMSLLCNDIQYRQGLFPLENGQGDLANALVRSIGRSTAILTEGTLKAQWLVKSVLDGLSTPFAELTVDPVPIHGAMEGPGVV